MFKKYIKKKKTRTAKQNVQLTTWCSRFGKQDKLCTFWQAEIQLVYVMELSSLSWHFQRISVC